MDRYNGDVVISGIAGKFPESDNLEEFWGNLYNGVDMVTEIHDRWNVESFEMPSRMGQLKRLDKFDADFLGVHAKQADLMDPRLRILLELTHEALIDAGVNPVTIRGSKTGVYVGVGGEEALDYHRKASDYISGYTATGGTLSMMANRISFTYNLQGPSMAVDTACSSSLLALQQALLAIRNGLCDAAIVAGAHICIDPMTTLAFTNLGLTSKEGKCKSFDATGEGYVRSEAAVVLYICKSQLAKRSYATVVHGKTNVDGYKTQGITFPSGIIQEKLLREVYEEAGVDPKDVDYVEAHGTGTRVGDPEEVNAIARVFCEGRDADKPLLIGSVKSNMGHPEPASGLCGIAKVILANLNGIMPGNLHYSSPNPDIPALIDGRIRVIDRNTEFNGSLVGVNSFGFGGANVHVLLKLTPRIDQVSWEPEIPVIVPFSGRTAEVESSLEKLMETKNHHLVALLQEISQINIPGHNFRSYAIQHEDEVRIKCEEMEGGEKRPIWFMFSGMGTQYAGMVRDMMNFRIFRESIEKSVETVRKYDFDLEQVLYSEDERVLDDGLNSIVAVTAIQVALIDLLNALGIVPDGIFGHSLGEVACAYADGCLTAEQTVLVSLARGRAFNKSKIPGAMASVGLTWAEAERRCPENVYPACHNAVDNVTISGPENLVTKFVKELQDEGVFARNVHSSGFAFHSRYMNSTEPYMREYLPSIVPERTERTPRWISTSVPEDKKNSDLDKYCSVDYFVNNALAPVRFFEVLQLVPQNAVVIEVAPHCLMQAILKRCLPNTVSRIGVMNRNAPNNSQFFLDSMGQLYLSGCNPNFSALYEKLELPALPPTPVISSVIRWDHADDWNVPICHPGKSGGSNMKISLNNEADSFYSGHIIDGRIIFPATGYMWLVWHTFAKRIGKKFDNLPVIFENLRFERNTMLPSDGTVDFSVNIFPDNGDFEVFEGDSAVFRGKIREFTKQPKEEMFQAEIPMRDESHAVLSREDFYKELRLRGYEYAGVFRGVQSVDINGQWAQIEWQKNWIGFLDTLLQISLTQQPNRGLYVPIRLQRAVIDPNVFHEFELNNKDGIPVTYLKHVKAVKVPGIEFRGLKVAIAPRKANQTVPTLSKQRFISYLKDAKDLSSQHCVESCLEIVMDNTYGRKFVLAEFSEDLENTLSENLVSLFPPKFENPDCFVISEGQSEKLDESGIKTVPRKDFKLAENANLVIASQENISAAVEIMAENGFLLIRSDELPSMKPEYQLIAQKSSDKLYMFRRKKQIDVENQTVIKINNENFDWVEKVKAAVKGSSRVYLVSHDNAASGMQGFVQCLLREGYENVRCFYLKDDNNNLDFENRGKDLEHQISLDLVFNVYQSGSWGCYCNLSVLPEELGKPRNVAESFVNALHPGDLSTVQWIESPLVIEQDERSNLCQVHYSSLNFRDVMLATGKLSRDALPGDLAFQECVLGIEFAGELNGKFVCGMQAAKCLATSVKIDHSGFLWEVPEKWSLAEAATVPVAYGTAYYALMVRGRMRKGETVLIHAGSGGVGQAAIAIALSRNCRVITTVSTAEKRQFLKNRFPQLDDDSFTDSRNASVFEKHVMEITNGRGVDIVLNSLAQDKLEASVRCLAKYGRFLEIGKFDLFNNTALGMEIFLRSVNFQGILLDDVIQGASDEKEEIADLIRDGIESGVVKPLPYSLFSNNQLEEAFRFMATGKHMGKVVVSIRDESPSEILALPRTYFHSHKSYVLVGGLGGMGLEIANWMVSRGARNLVFVSRSGVTSGYQAYRVKVWRDQGVNVIIDNSDVSTQAGAQSALKMAVGLGPVGGIFNLALVLKDAMFPNQTAEHFETVSKAKIVATIHLDIASRYLAPELDYFVTFSSAASSKGNPGQTSYGFANSFMERLCEERREGGLHGLAIQWGAIGDVGVLHNLMGGKDVAVAGVAPQKIASCLEMLDLFLQQSHPVVSSFVPASRIVSKDMGSKSLAEIVAHILGIKDLAKVNKSTTFVELGMDSLMATEIKQVIENKKNISLPVTAFSSLTFAKLMEMESNGVTPGESEAITEFRQYQLLPMPKEPLVQMVSKASNPTKFFVVHPLDGNTFLLERLMSEVEVTVYGFQCVKESPLDSIESLARFYIQQLRKVQSEGPYQIGGYSYGAAVAFEMALQLEKKGEVVENLILLDGCPQWPRFFTKAFIERELERDDASWLMYFLLLHMSLNLKKVEAELAALPDWPSRLDKAAQILGEVSPDLSVDEIKDLASLYSARLSAGYSYDPSEKVKSQVTLVRAGKAGFDRYLGNDYGLDQVCENPVEVFSIAGHHHCFHERPIELGAHKIINDVFDKVSSTDL